MHVALLILAWLACAAVSAAILAALLDATGIGGPATPSPGWDQPPADWVEEMRKRQSAADERGSTRIGGET